MTHVTKDISVSHHNSDIMFKAITDFFTDKALDFYGLHVGRIVAVESPDLPRIEVDEKRMDFVCLLEDDQYLHLEFQTTVNKKDLERFLHYDVSLYKKKQKPIKTVVIYGANVQEAPRELNIGSVHYTTEAVFMHNFDGDETYSILREKVFNGEELTDEDQLNLIFLPLMRTAKQTEHARSQRAIEAAELTKQIQDEQKRFFIAGCILALSDKFIDQDYVNRLMEVLKMSEVFRRIVRRGYSDAARAFLNARFGQQSRALQEKVEIVIESDISEEELSDFFAANSIEEADTVLERLMRSKKPKHLS